VPHPIDPVAHKPSAPDISVCLLMTLHNRARFVPAAIRSVLTQTLSTFHLIVVDDGSSDQAPDLVAQLAAEDAARLGRSRVTLIRSPRIGRFAALALAHDAAARLAPSALLGWVDSDDLLVDTALAETTAFLQTHPSCGMVYTQHIIIDEANRPQGLGPRCLVPYSPQALLLDFLTHHFRLFRPSLYRDIGGVDSSFTSAGDYDFCLKASERTTILHLPRPLYCYRVHPESISLARRDEQTANAARAIEAALVRRGLADRLRLLVTPDRRFQLVDR
jgi:glycosyltransferase involved in cell wall biosynthesis